MYYLCIASRMKRCSESQMNRCRDARMNFIPDEMSNCKAKPMEQKVLRFPDGKGGTTYRIQSPSGGWIETDENGTPLSGREEEKPHVEPRPPRAPARKPSREKSGLVSIHLTGEDLSLYKEYIRWRNFYKEQVSLSGFAGKVVMERVRKDREFMEFRKR